LQSIHDKQFYLPEQSPISEVNLDIRQNNKTGRQVLNGSYAYDEEFDKSTKELLEEITRVSDIIPVGPIDTNLKRVGWQRRWSKDKEKTPSSFSGRHFQSPHSWS